MPPKRKKETTRKKPKSKSSLNQSRLRLYDKIHAIAQDHPEFQGEGEGADPDGEAYTYVKAEQVFRVYGGAFRQHGLVLVPKEKQVTELHRMVVITAAYDIIDVESGEKVTIMGVGCGHNGFWAANTASTLALKQALLETFSACWPQPQEQAAVLKAEARGIMGDTQQLGEIISKIDEMNEYFGEQLAKKGNQNGKS